MLAFLAQTFTDEQDPTGFLNLAGPVLFGVVIPFIVARATTAETSTRIKTYVSVGLAVVAGALSVVGSDWSGLTIADVFFRASGAFAVAEGVYRVVNAKLLERDIEAGMVWAEAADVPTPRGLNEQPWVKPESGLV